MAKFLGITGLTTVAAMPAGSGVMAAPKAEVGRLTVDPEEMTQEQRAEHALWLDKWEALHKREAAEKARQLDKQLTHALNYGLRAMKSAGVKIPELGKKDFTLDCVVVSDADPADPRKWTHSMIDPGVGHGVLQDSLLVGSAVDPYAAVKAAYRAGRKIEVKFGGDKDWGVWTCADEPSWSWPPECYRVKREKWLADIAQEMAEQARQQRRAIDAQWGRFYE